MSLLEALYGHVNNPVVRDTSEDGQHARNQGIGDREHRAGPRKDKHLLYGPSPEIDSVREFTVLSKRAKLSLRTITEPEKCVGKHQKHSYYIELESEQCGKGDD